MVAGLYALAGSAWIFVSDGSLLMLEAQDPKVISGLQLLKGWFYVGATSLLLYWLVNHHDRRRQRNFERFLSLVDAHALSVWIMDGSRTHLIKPGPLAPFANLPAATIEPATWQRLVDPRDRAQAKREVRKVMHQDQRAQVECRLLLEDNRPRWYRIQLVPVRSESGRLEEWICTLQDIHDVKLAEARLHEGAERYRRLAHQDDLTGLPNRRRMRESLQQAMVEVRSGPRRGALLLLDLDQFKQINDTYGHAFGDRVLSLAGQRLAGCLRDRDELARLGGDEYTVILHDLPSSETVDMVAERINIAFRSPFVIDGQSCHTSVTIGIAIFPDDAEDPDLLTQRADQALYLGKEAGRNCHRFYSPELDQAAQRRARLELDLRGALERGELVAAYAPVVRLDSPRLAALQLHARWEHPEFGEIPEPVFLPVAESAGLIDGMLAGLLEQGCLRLARVRDTVDPELRLLVKVSARQFRQPGLIASATRCVALAGLYSTDVSFEISEADLQARPNDAPVLLEALHEKGFGLSLYGFGVGGSRLAQLKSLPVDSVKLAPEIVDAIDQNPNASATARAIIQLAQALGLRVVAEGTTRTPQVEFLREQGCHWAQGPIQGPVLLASELEAWVEQYGSSRAV